MIYRVEGLLFKVSKALAKQDFENWNNKKGERQNKNKEYSCLVGILAERAAEKHLNYKRKEQIKENIMNGIKERETGKFIGNGDIICVTDKKDYKIECKGITKGQRRGQVTVYHIDKYEKEKVDFVFFIEVEIFADYAECNVYHVDTVENIKYNKEKYCISPNYYGQDCYTVITKGE